MPENIRAGVDGAKQARGVVRRRIILGVTAAVLLTTSAGVAAAADSGHERAPLGDNTRPAIANRMLIHQAFTQPSPSPTEQSPTYGGHQMQGPLNAMHGELVIAKKGGGYQTLTTQTGIVTSINQTSIALKSQDGFARTYAITDSSRICAGRKGLSEITVGDNVWVIATGKGNSAPASLIADLSRP
ncbi:hypothetical protein ACQP1V_28950 [Microtetraspora malaysiensis]|uniref:hypothetical protein n=1 Tax=Microtetraspora malaysiensis TaxID=161358 RepID=UPI003D93F93F